MRSRIHDRPDGNDAGGGDVGAQGAVGPARGGDRAPDDDAPRNEEEPVCPFDCRPLGQDAEHRNRQHEEVDGEDPHR